MMLIPNSGYYIDVRTQLAVQGVEDRVIDLVEYVVRNGSITNTDVQNIWKVSKATATRLLRKAAPWIEKKWYNGKRNMLSGQMENLKGSQ
jgi:hypothetical protein